MLQLYDNEMRSVAERVAEAERQTRLTVGSVKGREEKYTEVFRTNIEREFRDFQVGALTCNVYSYTTEKQSGEEKRLGADLVFALDIDLDGARSQKGVLIQAKVNNNVSYGVTVDSVAKLRAQCRTMRDHSKESYVFAYGDQSTKVIKYLPVLSGAPLSKLNNKTVGDFFTDFFLCWHGDEEIRATSDRELEALVKRMDARAGVVESARTKPTSE